MIRLRHSAPVREFGAALRDMAVACAIAAPVAFAYVFYQLSN